MNLRPTIAGAAIGLAGLILAHSASAAVVFDNQNGLSVLAGPSSPFVNFTLSAPTYITLIDTYHFTTPLVSATFTIKNANTQATVFSTSSLVDLYAPFNHWQATPNITLAAGSYDFYDSEVSTWSYNAASGNKGFLSILSGTAPAIPEPASWAMLIAGFGVVGATQRRRRSGAVAA